MRSTIRAADRALRKQAHHLAGLQQFIDLSQGPLALAAGDRHHAEKIEEPAVRDVYLNNAKMTHRHLELVTEDYNLIHSAD